MDDFQHFTVMLSPFRLVSRLSETQKVKKQILKLKEGYSIRDQSKVHFITATVVDWIDVFTLLPHAWE